MKEPGVDRAIQVRADSLVVAQLAALMAMILVTFRLWFPAAAAANPAGIVFPSIPVFRFLGGVGIAGENLLAVLLLLSVLGGIIAWSAGMGEKIRVGFMLTVTVLLILKVLLNQHRFLPWAYQSILLFSSAALLGRCELLKFCRLLCVTIYLFSAISKFDYQFVMTPGRVMFHTLTGWIGVDSSTWSDSVLNLGVLCLPSLELLLGIGLIFPLTRTSAMAGAILMHGCLLLVLGPLGLHNAESVLIWNVLFMVQLVLLYWPGRGKEQSSFDKKPAPGRSPGYLLLATVLLVVPIAEKFGLADHWPAWGLYSPRSSRCRIWVANWKVETLPGSVQKHFRKNTLGSEEPELLRELDLARWSVESLNAPIYPQDRFQLGVAIEIVKQLELARAFQVKIESTAHWWTGERNTVTVTLLEELKESRKVFLVQ